MAPPPHAPLDAGEFSAWLAATVTALRTHGEADVPCGECVGCCSSSMFIHIEADEADARAHIPEALRFDAPGAPPGTQLMGHDEAGRCPMLILDDERPRALPTLNESTSGCRIYAHRPRTCRQFDCRVFCAAGLSPEEPSAVAEQARRWQFSYADDDARRAHDAVRATAAFLAAHPEAFSRPLPPTALGRALIAVRAHAAFLSDAASVDARARAIETEARANTPA